MRWSTALGYRLVTATALGAAAVGVVLPLVPTAPFLLVAAWSASRHSPALEARLLAHPRYGPPLRSWRESRALSRRTRQLALTALAVSVTLVWLVSLPLAARVVATLIIGAVACYLATRPEPVSGSNDRRGVRCD